MRTSTKILIGVTVGLVFWFIPAAAIMMFFTDSPPDWFLPTGLLTLVAACVPGGILIHRMFKAW